MMEGGQEPDELGGGRNESAKGVWCCWGHRARVQRVHSHTRCQFTSETSDNYILPLVSLFPFIITSHCVPLIPSQQQEKKTIVCYSVGEGQQIRQPTAQDTVSCAQSMTYSRPAFAPLRRTTRCLRLDWVHRFKRRWTELSLRYLRYQTSSPTFSSRPLKAPPPPLN